MNRTQYNGTINIHVYCTPSKARGFGWHYDAEDVFILQTEGSKEWSLRKNTVNPWPIIEMLPREMHYEREIMPLQKCLLSKGDWLYIPNGYWHSTRGVEESISLSIGIRSITGLDVLDYLREAARDSLLWRARLSLLGCPDSPSQASTELRDQLARLSGDLTQWLNGNQVTEEFLDWLRRRRDSIALSPPEVVSSPSPHAGDGAGA